MKKAIACLAYKVESFDTECFKEDLIAYDSEVILLVFNKNGVRVVFKPSDIVLKHQLLTFFHFPAPALDYILYPCFFIFDHLRIFIMFLWLSLKYDLKVVLVENTYVAAMVGVLKKMRLIKKCIYFPGDWLAGSQTKRGIWSHLGNNRMFPFFDYWACRFSDVTWNCTEAIATARHQHWGRTISKKERVFYNRLKIKTKSKQANTICKKIVFLGLVREDSGIDIVIKSLKDIKEHFDVTLKIIGSNEGRINQVTALARQYHVADLLEYLGYISRAEFDQALSDCFCGINLITQLNSYTPKTLPAKIFDYWQYLLPVVVTKNIGPTADLIETQKLGLVIEPNEKQFVETVFKIYNNQVQYRERIMDYVGTAMHTPIEELLNA